MFSKSVFEPGDSGENNRGPRGVKICADAHVCAGRRVGGVPPQEVAHMHVGACSFFSSPNMACEEGFVPVGVHETMDMSMCGSA